MFSFAHLWVFVLLPVPWLLRMVLPPRRVSEVSVRVPFGERLHQAMRGASIQTTRTGRRLIVLTLVWLLLLAALARPQWLEPPITRNQPTRDLLLLVDLSGSMKQEDFTNAADKR
jgi:Ca-activated chloride channel homolog